MELDDENEPYTINIPNEKITDQKLNCDDMRGVTVKKIEKKDVYVDDEEDDVDIDGDGQMQMGNMCILAENLLCDIGEDEWLIDEDSDHSLESDLCLSTSKKNIEDKNTNSKSPQTVTEKIKNLTFGSKINEPISNVKEIIEESDLASPEMIRHLQQYTNPTLNELYLSPHSNIPRPSGSTNIPGPSSSTSLPGSSHSSSILGPSCSTSISGPSGSINLPGPSSSTSLPDSSHSSSIPGPSCLTSILDPSGSINLPGPSSSANLPGSSYSSRIPGPSSSTSLPGSSHLSSIPGPSCSTSIPCPSGSINMPGPSSSANLPGSSYSSSIPSPSSSTSLPDSSHSSSIPGLSCSTSIPCPSGSINLPGPSSSANLPGSSYSSSIPGSSSSTSLPGLSHSSSMPGPSGSINLPGPSSSSSIPGPSSSTSFPGSSHLSSIPGPSCSTSIPGSSYSSSIPGPSSSTSLPGSSHSSSIPGPSCSTSIPGSSSSSSIPGPSSSTSLPGSSHLSSIPSPSGSINLPGLSSSTSLPGSSHSSSIPGPSCSTSIPNPSGSINLLSPSSSHKFPSLLNDKDSKGINLTQEQEVLLLGNFYNKIFMDKCGKQENSELNQDIKRSKLEECDYVKHYLLENTTIKNSDEEPETKNSECFEEDPDIVNPDIMYNIDLNEYYNELDLLALKVLKTPDDPTGLVEYNQLPPIPQIEQTHRKFTANERFRFANGISEYEYLIDRDDWNKIMVKRAVVFTAHAGFSIANEESLYVLADVAIDYVKRLAVIMKKHFDIQADNPYPDSIDPIDNSLQEIGVKGGIRELIEHYENDVFGRRNKLLKKCLHLKKIIDRQINDIIKPQNVNPEDFEEEYSTNEVEENVLSKEMDATTEEEKTEIESGIEEIIVETQYSTDENIFTDTEIEQIDPFDIDSTDIEVEINTDPENIKTNAMNIKDKKINSSRIPDSDNLTKIDLLKPLVFPTEYTQFGHSGSKEKLPFEYKHSCAPESDPDPPKSEKSLDLGTPKKVMEYLYSPLEESPQVQLDIPVENENDLGLSTMADQFDEDFEASFTDDNVQTIYVHTMSDIDEAMSLNDEAMSLNDEAMSLNDEAMSLNDDNADNYVDNSVQVIPVSNENDDSDSNIDYDIVSVHSFI